MRVALVALLSSLLFVSSATRGADVGDSAPPLVDQLLAHATALELSDAQVQALQAIRDRRVHSLDALTQRLRGAEAQSTAGSQQDSLTLMQEIGRLQVLSGREALGQLTPAQRQHWVELQRRAPTPAR